jgi:hypothetical protein
LAAFLIIFFLVDGMRKRMNKEGQCKRGSGNASDGNE